jgi:hypothetical protein
MNPIDKEKIAECYEDKEVTINGRDYKLLHVPYQSALKIIGLAQRIEKGLIFTGDAGWLELEVLLRKYFSVDGDILIKKPGHFDACPEDYMTFIAYATGMITYPFSKGTATS